MNPVRVRMWLQIEPKRSAFSDHIFGAKVVGLTQNKPEKPKAGTLLMSLTLLVERSSFDPLVPEVELEVPHDYTVPVMVPELEAVE